MDAETFAVLAKRALQSRTYYYQFPVIVGHIEWEMSLGERLLLYPHTTRLISSPLDPRGMDVLELRCLLISHDSDQPDLSVAHTVLLADFRRSPEQMVAVVDKAMKAHVVRVEIEDDPLDAAVQAALFAAQKPEPSTPFVIRITPDPGSYVIAAAPPWWPGTRGASVLVTGSRSDAQDEVDRLTVATGATPARVALAALRAADPDLSPDTAQAALAALAETQLLQFDERDLVIDGDLQEDWVSVIPATNAIVLGSPRSKLTARLRDMPTLKAGSR